MKKAIIEFNQEYWHLNTAFELALKFLDQGHEVYFYDFSHVVKNNSHHMYTNRYLRTKFPMLFPINQLAKRIKKTYGDYFYFISSYEKSFVRVHQIDESILQDAIYKDLVSELRQPKIEMRDHIKIVAEKKNAFEETYGLFLNEIAEEKIEEIYTFNGRFLHERAVWEVGKELNIPVKFHERFVLNWPKKYWIFNESVHDTEERAQVVKKFHSSSRALQKDTDKTKSEIAQNWYTNRKHSMTQNYTSSQNISFHKESKDSKLITFFTSSEDEIIYSNLESLNWPDQISTIRKIITIVNRHQDMQFAIRIHPNLANKSPGTISEWENLASEFSSNRQVRFYKHNDPIKTYDLLEHSDKVITAGSTLGVEASLIGKASLLLGRALHDKMQICQTVNDLDELEEYLVSYSENIDIEFSKAAEDYVVFLELGGIEFEYLSFQDNKKMKYEQDPKAVFFDKYNLKTGKLLGKINSLFNLLSQKY